MRIFNRKRRTKKIECAYFCHEGNVRKENQDHIFLCIDDNNVICREGMTLSGNEKSHTSIKCAVFDGMGGMSQGEMASLIAANMCAKDRKKWQQNEEGIKALFQEINSEIGEYRIKNRISDMGTTGVVAIGDAQEVVYGNIGDSRLYYFHKGKLQQCSIDHTMTQPYTGKRLLMQYLGIDSDYEIEPHLGRLKVESGSEILLCSDGLTDCLTDEEIEAILRSNSEVEMQLKAFMEMVLKREAQDNISIILCRWE